MAERIKKILIRAPNWIGDAVMCLPGVGAVKKAFPKAAVFVLAKPRVIPVFENNPALAGIVEYEAKRHAGIIGRLRLARELKKEGFDLAVLFQNAFDAAFIAFTASIPERIGYARDLRSGFLTTPIRVTEEIKKRHQIFYYLNVVAGIKGLKNGLRQTGVPPMPVITLAKDETIKAKAFIKEKTGDNCRLYGAAPGASFGKAKRWPPENFARAVKLLETGQKAVTIILGGPDDASACNEVARLLGEGALNLCGKTSLREAMAIIKELDLFITNDSGLMHVGSALKTPTVAIFGSTSPGLTGPIGKRVSIVKKEIDCAPCFGRECRYGHYACLALVTPEEVSARGAALLSSRAPALSK